MGFVGGELGYRLLNRICPTGDTGYMTGEAYRNKSKLLTILGPSVIDLVRHKVVIDFGCGPGAEAIEIARFGAQRVIGVDIREKWLNIAREDADKAGLGDRCVFCTTPTEPADIIISLDSFEHFEDPAAILRLMAAYLKPNGEALVSFGPTWYHPLGGHRFSVFPWAHLVFTEEALLRWRKNFYPQQTAQRITECGLNKMTIRRFQRLVENSPFRFAAFEARPISRLRRLASPITREVVTSVVICRLVHRASEQSTAA
jgi:2-polyprenyl-3-methyl-5-hydroxy-6-metoxy-1,4-benzoquinol methylase